MEPERGEGGSEEYPGGQGLTGPLSTDLSRRQPGFFQRTSDLILDTSKFLISSYLKVSLNSCFRNSIFTPKPVFQITIAISIKIIDHQSVGSEERREERERRLEEYVTRGTTPPRF